MMEIDPAFKSIPIDSTFFVVFRIQKLQVVPVSKDHYGQFYDGDSYIVACAFEPRGSPPDCQMKSREAKGQLEIHVHFWLGAETSQDEAAVAAYKTVELDDYLGGFPIQHREIQGHETKRFLSYFKNGLRILHGGIESGLRHVDLTTSPILYHVKGKRIPIVKEVQEIKWDAMNNGDSYILDTGKYVYVWVGKNSNHYEKLQAAKVARQMRAEHGPECEAVIILEDEHEDRDFLGHEDRRMFNEHLPLEEKDVRPAEETVADDWMERRERRDMKLFRCSDEEGTLKVVEEKVGPLEQEDLSPDDSFIIDDPYSRIWIWIGRRASKKERAEAMRTALGFAKKKGYGDDHKITRVIDGGEPVEFKSLFKTWRVFDETHGAGKANSVGRIAKVLPEKFDVSLLHSQPSVAAEYQMPDDGTGSKKVYRVKEFDLVIVEPKDHGNFFRGDSYVIHYTYRVEGKGSDRHIIYYWLGSQSSIDEQATAAMKCVRFDDTLGGVATQIRVVEGREPPHFTAMFGGKMKIYDGGFQSGFRRRPSDGGQESDSGSSGNYLLQVRGTSAYNTKAIEVPCRASSLNSNDVFLLVLPSPDRMIYIWSGKGSTGDEREMAKQLADKIPSGETITVYEGHERDEFWDAIGGREDYASSKKLQLEYDPHPPRLFCCSNASGQFKIEEIVNFNQADLIPEDVMMLDAWDVIYLWIGSQSNETEKAESVDAARKYLELDPSGRPTDIPIVTVKEGHEPNTFTGFFGAWNPELFMKKPSLTELKSNLKENGTHSPAPVNNGDVDMDNNNVKNSDDFETCMKFPVEKLRIKDPISLPHGIDPTKKEIYLTVEDFKNTFGMSYKEYQSLPKWKQTQLKQKVGLF